MSNEKEMAHNRWENDKLSTVYNNTTEPRPENCTKDKIKNVLFSCSVLYPAVCHVR